MKKAEDRKEHKKREEKTLNSKRAGRKKEKYEGFPRPGGNFVAPGNKRETFKLCLLGLSGSDLF
jgi:hypothetical protein